MLPEAAFVGESFVGDAPTIAELKRLADRVRQRGREERRAFRRIGPSRIEIFSEFVLRFRWSFRFPSAAMRRAGVKLVAADNFLPALLGLLVTALPSVRMRRVVQYVIVLLLGIQLLFPAVNQTMAGWIIPL